MVSDHGEHGSTHKSASGRGTHPRDRGKSIALTCMAIGPNRNGELLFLTRFLSSRLLVADQRNWDCSLPFQGLRSSQTGPEDSERSRSGVWIADSFQVAYQEFPSRPLLSLQLLQI